MQTLKLQQLRNAIPSPDINPGKMSGFHRHSIYLTAILLPNWQKGSYRTFALGDNSRDDP
jgi:hypothetical protein